MIVVSDAGPLIYLGGVGRLELLRDLFGRVVGTLGLLVRGKRAGRLDAVRPIVEALVAMGLRVSPDLVEEILVLAEEK